MGAHRRDGRIRSANWSRRFGRAKTADRTTVILIDGPRDQLDAGRRLVGVGMPEVSERKEVARAEPRRAEASSGRGSKAAESANANSTAAPFATDAIGPAPALGVAPIAWSNSDLPQLGGETTLETCLRESRKAGFSGTETGVKFPMDAEVLGPILAEAQAAARLRLVLRRAAEALGQGRAGADPRADGDLQGARRPGARLCRDHRHRAEQDRRRPVAGGRASPTTTSAPMARKLTELAEWMADFGVPMTYHHHMGTVIETQREIDLLMANTGAGRRPAPRHRPPPLCRRRHRRDHAQARPAHQPCPLQGPACRRPEGRPAEGPELPRRRSSTASSPSRATASSITTPLPGVRRLEGQVHVRGQRSRGARVEPVDPGQPRELAAERDAEHLEDGAIEALARLENRGPSGGHRRTPASVKLHGVLPPVPIPDDRTERTLLQGLMGAGERARASPRRWRRRRCYQILFGVDRIEVWGERPDLAHQAAGRGGRSAQLGLEQGDTLSERRSAVSMTKMATWGRSARTRRKNAATSSCARCLGGEDFISR